MAVGVAGLSVRWDRPAMRVRLASAVSIDAVVGSIALPWKSRDLGCLAAFPSLFPFGHCLRAKLTPYPLPISLKDER